MKQSDDKYEYIVQHEREQSAYKTQQILNHYGEGGWRLVSAIPDRKDPDLVKLFLMREKKQ